MSDSKIAPNEQQPCVYKFGPFRLNPKDPPDQRLRRDGTPVDLTPMEFALLYALVRERRRKLRKEELVKELWPNAWGEPQTFDELPRKRRESYLDNLHHHTSSLRKKLGENENEKYIDTKNGYSLVPPVKLYDELEFERWIFHPAKGRRITLALGSGVALSILYLIFGRYLIHSPPEAVLSLIQASVVLGAFIASFFIFDPNGIDFEDAASRARARPVLKQYFRYWRLLLASWFLLYLLLFFAKYLEGRGGQSNSNLLQGLYITVTLFNNCNSLAIALCYVVLNNPADFREEVQRTRHNRLDKILQAGGLIFILLFALVEFLLTSGQSPNIAKVLVERADVISGLVGGITLALYVSLLHRRFIDRSSWLPIAFYLYAAIQPLYFVIVVWGVWIIEAALILKCLLYLYIAWLFKSGRLLVLFSSDESKI